jgi:hypothetical protein
VGQHLSLSAETSPQHLDPQHDISWRHVLRWRLRMVVLRSRNEIEGLKRAG